MRITGFILLNCFGFAFAKPDAILSKPVPATPDSFLIRESFNATDTPVNEYMKAELKPVRENFKRINSFVGWDSIIVKDVWESSEGGELSLYYSPAGLEKILVRHYAESGQKLTEYYLLNSKLSFVFERSLQYKRPIGWDSARAREHGDTLVFDPARSKILEERSYFINEKLVHQVNNEDCGSPFSEEYLLKEEKRILSSFHVYLKY